MNVIGTPDGQREDTALMTAKQVARRWRVSRDTVYRVPAVYLPYLKLGPNTRRYRLSDVLAYEETSLIGRR